MKVTKNFVLFWGSIFSQWDKTLNSQGFQFEENGIRYTSCEQYMMYHKALLFDDGETAAKILKTNNVKTIKALGREVKNFDGKIWDEHKFNIVVNGNFLKFSQNENLKKEMLQYKDKEFVEGSPKDRIWGVGLHYNDIKILDKRNWRGENLLGKALTKVCKLLQEK